MSPPRTPTCRTCTAPVLFAAHHSDDRRLPYDVAVVDHDTPDSNVLVSGGSSRRGQPTLRAWDLADLVHHTAQTRGWTDTRAAAFIADAWPSHRRHRCHQTPTTTGAPQ